MPMSTRRPNLSSLVVPTGLGGDDLKTPLPHTPLSFCPASVGMIMTPDTPSFGFSNPFDHPVVWTEEENDLISSYLSHPPRPLRHVYPPESLPPPEAIDEITAQIVSAPTWTANKAATRARLLEIARKQVSEYQLGPKREPIVAAPVNKVTRPRLGQTAFSMSRQQNSMDSLYGDAEVGTFSEALRLSSDLQCTASNGAIKDLSSVGDLASPLDFTFSMPSFPFPRRPSSSPRPSSLLQRGRSFTGQDLANIPLTIEEGSGTEDESMTPEQRGRVRSASSPVSSFTTSPPSSTSSQARSDTMDTAPSIPAVLDYGSTAMGEGNLEVEVNSPHTPLNIAFFTHYHSSGNSDGTATPAITLTADSPEMTSDTPRLLSAGRVHPNSSKSSPTSPSRTMAELSLSNDPRPQIPPRRPGRSSGTRLLRSFSEGNLPGRSPSPAVIPPLILSDGQTRKSRTTTLARPTVKRQRSGMPNLSVIVPQSSMRRVGQGLKSPFEPRRMDWEGEEKE